IDSVLVGQYLLPVYRLPAGQASNAVFGLGPAPGGAASLLTGFQAGTAGTQAYKIFVHVNIGLGDDVFEVLVFGPPPTTSATPGRRLAAQLVPRKMGKKKKTIRLVVRVFYTDTGAEKATFLAPFQMPAYRNISVSVLDRNGDGIADAVLL